MFGVGPDEVQAAVGDLAKPSQFGGLVWAFFAEFAHLLLNSFLSRTVGEQVGPGRAFGTLDAHDRFRNGLKTHCFEAAKIVEAFAGEWLSKHNWRSAKDIDRETVAAFAAGACKKLDDEFQHRGAA